MIHWIICVLATLIVYRSDQLVNGQFNYSICENAICFGLPGNCVDTLNCSAVGTVVKISSDAYRFEMQTIPSSETNPLPVYVAIGLSLDSRMEDDSTVECVMSNNQIEVFMSYTKQGPRGADRHTYTDEITVTDKSYNNGSIRCVFERKARTVINNQTFDLNRTPYHLLLSVGSEVNVNSLTRHTIRLASSDPLIVPDTEELPNQSIDYDACGVTQTCFGMPNGCATRRNCHTVVAITHTPPTYKFQIATSSGAAYVAVGLSTDNKMGSDSVVECVRDGNGGTVNMYTSYTRNDHTGSDRHPSNGLATLLDSSYVNGLIYCYVDRNESGAVFGQEFNLSDQPFYILLAIGDEVTTTSLVVHKQREVSAQAINLQDILLITEAAAKPLLIKLHGCFMIFAWMGTAAVGLVLARYFKTEWSEKQMFGKDLWFIGHVTCMVITWTLTVIAFIMIFVHVGGWTQIGNTHGILGTIVTILCFFHPIGAAFRPDVKDPTRYRFNIGHYFGGRLAFLLAIVNIFYAIFISSAEMPIWFIAFMVPFVIVFWGNHILMGLMEYLAGGKRNLVRSFIGPAKRIDYATADYNAWFVRLKMKVFALYLVGIITLVIGSICVVIFHRSS